jgi:hypothetical protein
MRLYDGLVETRMDMLKSKPNVRNNWIGMAIAYQLVGEYSLAANTLSTFEETFKVQFLNYTIISKKTHT